MNREQMRPFSLTPDMNSHTLGVGLPIRAGVFTMPADGASEIGIRPAQENPVLTKTSTPEQSGTVPQIQHPGLKQAVEGYQMRSSKAPQESWKEKQYAWEIDKLEVALKGVEGNSDVSDMDRAQVRHLRDDLLGSARDNGRNIGEILSHLADFQQERSEFGNTHSEDSPKTVSDFLRQAEDVQRESRKRHGGSEDMVHARSTYDAETKSSEESVTHIPNSDLEEAYKKGPDALRELYARHGVKEGGAGASSENYSTFNYEFTSGTPEWDVFKANAGGYDKDGLVKFFAESILEDNGKGVLYTTSLDDIEQRAMRMSGNKRMDAGELSTLLKDIHALKRNPELRHATKRTTIEQRFKESLGELAFQTETVREHLKSELERGDFSADWVDQNIGKIAAALENEGLLDAKAREFLGGSNNILTRLRAATTETIRLDLGQELYDFVASKYVNTINPAEGMRGEQIDAIIDSEYATEKLITRIISMPLLKKKQMYRLGFYPQNNLDIIEQGIQDRIDSVEYKTSEHEKRVSFRNQMTNKVEGIQHIHNMNFMISTNQLQEFMRYAANINNEHIHAMLGEKGASRLMRLFEVHFDRFLATDGRITTVSEPGPDGKAGSFDRIMGYQGKDGTWNEGTVSESFDRMYELMGEKLGGMEEYQRDFVKSVGEYLYMTFMRASEKTALGKLPEGPAFISKLPGGDITAMLNWYGNAVRRWELAKPSGGQKYAEMATEVYDQQRIDHGYDVPLLKEIKGVDVATMEYALMTGAQAHNRSWREAVIYLDNTPFFDPRHPDRKISLLNYLQIGDDSVKERVDAAFESNKSRGRDAVARATTAVLRESFLTPDGQLRSQFNSGLGALLMTGVLRPSDVAKQNYGKEYTDMLQEIRTAVFNRATENNPLEVAFMLQGLEVQAPPSPTRPVRLIGETEDAFRSRVSDWEKDTKAWDRLMTGRTDAERRAYADRARNLKDYFDDPAHKIDINGSDKAAWFGFKNEEGESIGLMEKLTIANELRLDSIKAAYDGKGVEKTIEEILRENPELQLIEDEPKLLDKILAGGRKAAKDLANIRFPNTPFLNDIIYENANYRNAGPTSFGSAFADVVKYNETQGKIGQLVISPADAKPEDVIGIFKEAVIALEDPLGTADAQDLLYGFVEAYCGFIWAGGVKKDMGKSSFAEMMDQVNVKQHIKTKWAKMAVSLAQVYGGNKAPAFTVEQMDDFIKQLVVHRAIRKGIYGGEHGEAAQFEKHQMREAIKHKLKDPILKLMGKKTEDEIHPYEFTDQMKKLKKRFHLDGWWWKMLKNIFDISAIALPVAVLDTAKEGGKGQLD